MCAHTHIHLLSVYFSQFPKRSKHHNLLFSILSRDRDYRDDNSILNIWVHIQEKPATISPNNEQWTHFKHRYKTADINVSLCSGWWSKFYAESLLHRLVLVCYAHCTLQVSGYTLCTPDYDKVDIVTVSLCNKTIPDHVVFWLQDDSEYSHLQHPTGQRAPAMRSRH
jgi:hypothetical protein